MFILVNINWDAVSSISNIALSLITLIAVFVTYRTLIVSTNSKAEIRYKTDKKPNGTFHRIRLVNKRNVPITVIHKGFYINDKDKMDRIISGKKVQEKIYNSDITYYSLHENGLNAKLRRLGYPDGSTVNIYGYFITSDKKKVYSKKVKHKIIKYDESTQLN